MTAPARFKKEDLARAVAGVTKGGMRVGRIEIDPNGRIVILPESVVVQVSGPTNPWDEDLKP